MWRRSHRADPDAVAIADRHYSRQKPGSPQFVPPGRCFVLLAGDHDTPALWVTSWPFPEYVKHQWAGAWVCSLFRNEGAGLSSVLISEAVAATRWRWPHVPALGIVTFVNAAAVRQKRDPGYCFLKAGFEAAGTTQGGLLAFLMAPSQMPPPCAPAGQPEPLFLDAAM